jgi:hypothetical protein
MREVEARSDVRTSETRSRATCACGSVVFEVAGDPALVVACHCTDCQRRTGSSHQVAVWYRDEDVRSSEGTPTVYRRSGDRGVEVTFEFCGRCGSTVSWTIADNPGARAFAAGAFASPDLPAPQLEFFTSRRARWQRPIEGAAQFEAQ